jgi:site-specific recombinase XerD
MVEAMVLGGLRRGEVLGLRLGDLRVAERRVFIAEGKGGHQRLIPVSGRFFASVGSYLDAERPADADTDRLLVVLKGPHRGRGAVGGWGG